FLLQRLVDNRFENLGYLRVQSLQGFGWPVEDGVVDHHQTFPDEGSTASRHFVQHQPEGEDVGPRIQPFPANLFGRHVAGGARGGSGSRQVGGNRTSALDIAIGGSPIRRRIIVVVLVHIGRGRFREAEVQYLRQPLSSQKNICRLDVAMNDFLVV